MVVPVPTEHWFLEITFLGRGGFLQRVLDTKGVVKLEDHHIHVKAILGVMVTHGQLVTQGVPLGKVENKARGVVVHLCHQSNILVVDELAFLKVPVVASTGEDTIHLGLPLVMMLTYIGTHETRF